MNQQLGDSGGDLAELRYLQLMLVDVLLLSAKSGTFQLRYPRENPVTNQIQYKMLEKK